MKKPTVVTDSTATVPKDLVQQLGIHVVPVLLTFGDQTFRDGVDIRPSEAYRQLRTGIHLPKTSAPSVGDFLRVYATVGREASGIVSIHMSSDLSATYSTAVLASRLIDDVPIRIVNCGTAAMGQGFVVLEAARAAASGATLDEVVSRAEEMGPRMNIFLTLDTLKYLHRGGRVGGVATLAGTVLQIKPVLHLVDGRVEPFAKPRTRRKATRLILQQVAKEADGRQLHAAIFHADVPEEAQELRLQVAERFNCSELYVTEFTPVMGAHTGPGVLGVAFYVE